MRVIVAFKQKPTLCGLLLLLLFSHHPDKLSATEADFPAPTAPAANSQQIWLDSVRDSLTDDLIDYSNRIDNFFMGSNQRLNPASKSRGELGLITIINEGGDWTIKPRLTARIDLPHTKERLKLEFQADDNEISKDRKAAQTTTKQESLTLGLSFQQIITTKSRVRLRAGMRGSGGLLDPYLHLRAGITHDDGAFHIDVSENLFSERLVGNGYATALQMAYELNPKLRLSSASSITWYNDQDLYQLNQDIYLRQWLNHQQILTWQFGMNGEVSRDAPDKPQDNDYFVGVTHQQPILRDWLLLSLTPELHYPRDNAFTPTWLFTLKLVAIFGWSE
ncbi:MAG: hypothetical protein HQL49_09890 [Gammaproteobacteria bacterium]|nr:hypothetical protein [Gammaproteobacteria bacterium]